VAGIGIDSEIATVCEQAVGALRGAGIEVDEIDLDLSYGRDAFLALRGHWFVSHLYGELARIDEFGHNVATNLRSGLEVTARQLGAAENTRGRMREELLELLSRYSGLLTPCMAIPPFPAEQSYPATIAGKTMRTYIDWVAPTFLLSLPGLPVRAFRRASTRRGCRWVSRWSRRPDRSRVPWRSPRCSRVRGPSGSLHSSGARDGRG